MINSAPSVHENVPIEGNPIDSREERRGYEQVEQSDSRQHRSRSVSVSSYSHRSVPAAARSPRDRSHSSASASRRSRTTSRAGTEGISVLSVEVAMTRAEEYSTPPSCSTRPSHRRSRSVSSIGNIRGSGRTTNGFEKHHERTIRSSTQVEVVPTSPSDHGAGSDGERWHPRRRHHVIRAHQARRSMPIPSVVDLFNLTLARATESTNSLSTDDAKLPGTSEPSGSSDGDNNDTPAMDGEYGTLPLGGVERPLCERSASEALERASTRDHSSLRQRHLQQRKEEESHSALENPWPPGHASNSSSNPEYGVISAGEQSFAAKLGGSDHTSDTTGQVGRTAVSKDSRDTAAARSSDLSFSGRCGETFGTVASSDHTEVQVEYTDAICTRMEEKHADLDALECGDGDGPYSDNGHRTHHGPLAALTARNDSGARVPTLPCTTPVSPRAESPAVAAAAVSFCHQRSRPNAASTSSPNYNAFELSGSRPTTRFQNEAKHVAEQKRGVTTSYKTEESYKHYHKITLFVVLLGIITGLGSHGIDTVIVQLGDGGLSLVEHAGGALGGSVAVRFFFFWLYVLTMTLLAAFLTSYFCPAVEGSGIPAMKYMMDTDNVVKKLKSFTLLALTIKASGLMLAAGGGLNIGREGPYTHMAGMVTYQLIKRLPHFRDILQKETVVRQVLAASVAAGVSSTFAATLGGVLFSIEITTINYDLGNYFKAFVAAISGTVAVSLVRTLAEGSPAYIEREFSRDELKPWQYVVFALMAVVYGFLGPVYINFRLKMLQLARKWGKHAIRKDTRRRWEYVRASMRVACLVATATAILAYFPGEFTRTKPFATFKNLLTEGSLDDSWASEPLGSIFVSLPITILINFVTAALGTSISVPSGDFIQTAVMGALIGRLVGEAMDARLGENAGVVPSTFALVGAAGMSCAATQTISAAVVIMEMTGSFELDKPVLLAAVLAFGLSRRFGLNIYDSVMKLNGLESLCGLDMWRSEEMMAKDIMQTKMIVVPCQATIGELVELLQGEDGGKGKFASYPVVLGLDSMAFVGTISRKDLAYIVLTGGTKTCHEYAYFEYAVEALPKRDVAACWERLGSMNNYFERLPKEVRHEVSQYMPSALSTVRAIKYFGDKLANLGPDMSFIKYTMRSTTKGHTHSTIKRRPNESRDPMDRHNRSSRMDLTTLLRASFEEHKIENPFPSRTVDLIQIASRASRDVQIDRSVWKAHETMPLKHVHLLFANLRCIRLFVIAGDRLTGIISRSILYHAMSNREIFHGMDSSAGRTSAHERQRVHPWAIRPRRKKWYDVLLGKKPRPPAIGLSSGLG